MVGRSRSFTTLLFVALLASSARAQPRLEGFGPDLQVAGGVGFGLGTKLDNNFLGRVRAGALYAFEPYWLDAGLTLELGAVSELAVGGELEWNQWNGFYANLGLAYAKHERLAGHLGVGFMIFGLEWQHAFASPKPTDALLFVVRFPLGFWWFAKNRQEQAPAPPPGRGVPAAESGGVPRAPRPLGPTQPSAASAAAPDDTPQRRAQRALDEAAFATARADHAAVSDALRRAYAAVPDPLLWLRIADADLARGKIALAAEDLQHFLASAESPEVLAQRPRAEARLAELLPRLARLRLTLAAESGAELLEIDGIPQPGALLGYDVLLDPGPHVLVLKRAGEPVYEHRLEARAGELIRLTLPLPAAGSPAER